MALITKIEELKPYLPVAYGTSLTTVPGMDSVELDFIVPVLGNDLYQDISAAYAAHTTDGKILELIRQCRAVIAPFAYVENLPFLQTLITNNGVIALEAQDSRKAYKWEYNKVVAALERMGYAAQEKLILFLTAHKADYPLWASSPYNSLQNIGLIRNGVDLEDVSGLQQPHRCFLKMKPLMQTVVMMHLHKGIGEVFYEAFNARLLNGTASNEERHLVFMLRPVLARRTLEYASVELSLTFNGSSFTVTDSGNKDNEDEGRKGASDIALQRFREQMQQTATFFLEKAIEYLNAIASATIFPEYFASDLYAKNDFPDGLDHRNVQFQGIFVS